jgi:hypothetical protein
MVTSRPPMATLDHDPTDELQPIGRTLHGRDLARAYYEHFFANCQPRISGYGLRSEWVSDGGRPPGVHLAHQRRRRHQQAAPSLSTGYRQDAVERPLERVATAPPRPGVGASGQGRGRSTIRSGRWRVVVRRSRGTPRRVGCGSGMAGATDHGHHPVPGWNLVLFVRVGPSCPRWCRL